MLRLFFLLILLLQSGSSYAQLAQAKPMPAESEVQEAPIPEPPKQIMNIELKDDLLSIELANVEFGTVISAIGEKAGFVVEGSGSVFSRMLNTRFSDIEVERGVTRILTLVKESNYMIHYDTKGSISRIEIYGSADQKGAPVAAAGKQRTPLLSRPQSTSTPVQPQPRVPQPVVETPAVPAVSVPVPPSQRPTPRSSRIRRPAAIPSVPPPQDQSPQPVNSDDSTEEEVMEIPLPSFTPPQPNTSQTRQKR